MSANKIPKTQTVVLVHRLGETVEFVDDYPVKMPGRDEVLAKVLYTGVCKSGLSRPTGPKDMADHALYPRCQISIQQKGTAAGPDGSPITAIKLPHIDGHEGVGRLVALGPGLGPFTLELW